MVARPRPLDHADAAAKGEGLDDAAARVALHPIPAVGEGPGVEGHRAATPPLEDGPDGGVAPLVAVRHRGVDEQSRLAELGPGVIDEVSDEAVAGPRKVEEDGGAQHVATQGGASVVVHRTGAN